VTRAIGPWIRRLAPELARADRIRRLTGISRQDWRELQGGFPDLPPDLGPRAARSRERLQRLSSRALSTGRWPVRLEGDPPSAERLVFLTAHVGALQALRYVLRARGIAVSSVLGPLNLERSAAERLDAVFDRKHPLDFPHALAASRVHRLRVALRTGCLILAADLPEGPAIEQPLLGGCLRVDPRPLRLARAARVACRAAFLTQTGRSWTLTLGAPLPREESAACALFADLLDRVVRRSPEELDGVVYRALAKGAREGLRP